MEYAVPILRSFKVDHLDWRSVCGDPIIGTISDVKSRDERSRFVEISRGG